MSTPAEPPSREGELLAQKYRLEKRLGTGGQGEVYRARNELIGREVAIKLLRGEWAQDPTTVTRFVREARAANMVRHPNVVDVLDIGTENGAPFIVQELLTGQTLDDYLDVRGGRLLPPEVYDLAIPVCEAVGAAHARGVIHRDLKPGNVFLVRSASTVTPKVLDFGLAKVSEAHGEIDVTTTGAWFGTPAYMPPEQIRHTRTVDARSDVWALGVMLYELLAGRRPFDSHTVGDLFVVICTEDPSALREFAPHVSESLARVIHRCIQREPERRYANAAELATDLKAARSGGELLEVTLDSGRRAVNDAVTAIPGRAERPKSAGAEEAIDETRIRGEPNAKRVTPAGGEQNDVAKSETLQAVPLDSEPKKSDPNSPAPVDAKRSPASASGELAAAHPSSTAPAEISTTGSRALDAKSRTRTWIVAVTASIAIVSVAAVVGLRGHESPNVGAASGETAPVTQHAATAELPRPALEAVPPMRIEPTPAPVAVPANPSPAVAVQPNAQGNSATPTSGDLHGLHRPHHVASPTPHAVPTPSVGATQSATSSAGQSVTHAIAPVTTQPAGTNPSHEMHGATRYEP